MADSIPPSRKRKRRRQDKSSMSARLVLDDHVRGDIGIISEDLFTALFPGFVEEEENQITSESNRRYQHVAITPWGPSNAVQDSSWTIVPVRPSSALAQSTVQFSPSSLALQCFAEALQRFAPSKISSHSRSGIEIRILDVLPIALHTVFVALEGASATRLENGEGTFHGEHARSNGIARNSKSDRPEDRLSAAVRESLGSLTVVHSGDVFSLPLPPHPITHALPPPAKVTLCEPVSQGVLSPSTKIIITRTGHHSTDRKRAPLALARVSEGIAEVEEDTSNDQFFSAAEDRYKTDAVIEEDDSATETETEVSSGEIDDLSDDSMDDMISLQAPMLPAHNASGISTMQAGTPMTIGRGRNGTHTPGSMFSTFTATTARAGGQRGRLFQTKGLSEPLAEELLHPKPSIDDDEEARVFVDINSLSKIGCFSGDWVRFEVATEPPAQGAGLWGLGSFGQVEEEPMWRPVKVYGLPESHSSRPMSRIPGRKHEGRRMSFFESQVQKPTSPTAYLSPILLANLQNTPYCRLSPLKRLMVPKIPTVPKITNSSRPLVARELTLLKVATPFSTERSLQNVLFSGLKKHFSSRNRIVQKGDLIGIPIDESLGRTLYQASAGEDSELEGLLSSTSLREVASSKPTAVAWFKIGHLSVLKEQGDPNEDEDIWGGTATIDAQSTRMLQSGSEQGRIPGTIESCWESYLGLKVVAKSGTEASPIREVRKPQVTPLQRRLRELIAAATSPRAIYLELGPLAILLVSTQRNIGKATIAQRATADIGLHTFVIDGYDIVSDGGQGSDVKTAGLLEARAERAMNCGPQFCALLIRHIEALTADRMVSTLKNILAGVRVLIATTTEVDKIPDGVRGLFTHELEMNAPDEREREGILESIVDNQSVELAPDLELSAVAVKTAALVAGDLVDVVDRALVARTDRLDTLSRTASTAGEIVTVRDLIVAGGPAGRCLTKGDFDQAVDAARKNFADAIGAPKIPNVTWDDVGGLSNVKDAVIETIQLPLERPELFAKGMKKRSGILFYGPPGTGKTLLAKAIATEFSLNFFSVKGPELLNMYIGESEANVRRVFQRARDARPCVVFFDELDSVAPKRGNQGDSGGVMDRIVSQLLAELDGMSDGEEGGGGVFVIGATNRPDLLDQALLRPGRFDKMLYLGVSDTHEKQLTIMEALTRKFTLHPSLSLTRVASRLPFTYTGADFYALCSDAMLKAVTRQAASVDSKIKQMNSANSKIGANKVSTAYFFDHYATKEDVAVMVTEDDFINAERELIPSVSAKELEHYQKVRAQFEKPEEKANSTSNHGVNGKSATVKGMPEGQQQRAPLTHRPRSSGKGKGKEKAGDDKGKGKAVARWDEGSDDEVEHVNGYGSRYKGKGKAVDRGFRDGTVEEEEELY